MWKNERHKIVHSPKRKIHEKQHQRKFNYEVLFSPLGSSYIQMPATKQQRAQWGDLLLFMRIWILDISWAQFFRFYTSRNQIVNWYSEFTILILLLVILKMCLYSQCQSIFICMNFWGLEKYDLSQGVNWTWKFNKKYGNIIDPQLNSALVIPVTHPRGNSSNLLHMCPSVLSHSVMSDSLWPHGLQPIGLLCPWGFSWQEYWGGLPCSSPGDLLKSGIEPRSPAVRADSLPSKPPGKPPYVSNPLPNLPVSFSVEDFISYFVEKVKSLGRKSLMTFK